jgi:hypothetical protein
LTARINAVAANKRTAHHLPSRVIQFCFFRIPSLKRAKVPLALRFARETGDNAKPTRVSSPMRVPLDAYGGDKEDVPL